MIDIHRRILPSFRHYHVDPFFTSPLRLNRPHTSDYALPSSRTPSVRWTSSDEASQRWPQLADVNISDSIRPMVHVKQTSGTVISFLLSMSDIPHTRMGREAISYRRLPKRSTLYETYSAKMACTRKSLQGFDREEPAGRTPHIPPFNSARF